MEVYACMYVCMYVKGGPCGIAHGKGQPTGPRGEVPKWTYFPHPASKIGSWHTPTAYYRQSAGSAADFALGLTGLPRDHRDQSGKLRPCNCLMLTARPSEDLKIRFEWENDGLRSFIIPSILCLHIFTLKATFFMPQFAQVVSKQRLYFLKITHHSQLTFDFLDQGNNNSNNNATKTLKTILPFQVDDRPTDHWCIAAIP